MCVKGKIVIILFLRRHYPDQVQGSINSSTSRFRIVVSGRSHPLGVRSGICEVRILNELINCATYKLCGAIYAYRYLTIGNGK